MGCASWITSLPDNAVHKLLMLSIMSVWSASAMSVHHYHYHWAHQHTNGGAWQDGSCCSVVR